MFHVGHSMGGAIVSNIIPQLQHGGAVMWAPGNVVYYDISSRVHAVPGHYEEFYDIGVLKIQTVRQLSAVLTSVIQPLPGPFRTGVFALQLKNIQNRIVVIFG